ncbi:hypothetical protein ACE102_44665 (plasmid) [Bradyrhizobium sp. vgs-9]|uniref:hypothetical protein n=1 Tax=Bradyrhizobium TaxID=374 RepID=UPI00339091D3
MHYQRLDSHSRPNIFCAGNSLSIFLNTKRTVLSELERQFIERRLAEEQVALKSLAAETFPVAFAMPNDSAGSEGVGAEP